MGIKSYLAQTVRKYLTLPEDVEGPRTVREYSPELLRADAPHFPGSAGPHGPRQLSPVSRRALGAEIVDPIKVLVNKAKHSFELFLTNRTATVRFIASAYSFQELADDKKLNRIFRSLKQEFEGFVDLGLIDANGVQVSYTGPYDLREQELRGPSLVSASQGQ